MRKFYDTFETKKRSFRSNARLELGKKSMLELSNSLRLSFRYLEIIQFLHPRYHPKIIGEILKNVQK